MIDTVGDLRDALARFSAAQPIAVEVLVATPYIGAKPTTKKLTEINEVKPEHGSSRVEVKITLS